MQTNEELKAIVREKYGEIAENADEANQNGCCDSLCGCGVDVMAEDYTKLEGYVAGADLGLGCGLPTEYAMIKEGDIVVDLGSGAGNDAFIARRIVGDTGKVIGVDMTASMIQKARANTVNLNYDNVEFRLGEIENMPIAANSVDVVVSNCVLNLIPEKHKALAETFRILKPHGHFSISDIVIKGNLPDKLKHDAEMYAGCISGAIDKDEYISIVKDTGFQNIKIQKERKINLPDQLLQQYFSAEELEAFKTDQTGIYSVTVYADKPTPETSGKCC